MADRGEIFFSTSFKLKSEHLELMEKLINDTFEEWIRSPAGRNYILEKIAEHTKHSLYGFFGFDSDKNSRISQVKKEITDRLAEEIAEALKIVAAKHKEKQ